MTATIELQPVCTKCHTEIMDRKVVIGRIGAILIPTCECRASKLALNYATQRVRNKERKRKSSAK